MKDIFILNAVTVSQKKKMNETRLIRRIISIVLRISVNMILHRQGQYIPRISNVFDIK